MKGESSLVKKHRLENINIVRVMLVKDVSSSYRIKSIKKSDDAASVARKFLANEDREVFIALNLDRGGKINSIHVVSMGSASASIVEPREVFKAAILSNTSHIVLAHNHPSGDPQPSDEDRKVTLSLIEVGRLLGIKVVDHIIIGDGKYTSFGDTQLENRKMEFIWSTKNFEDDQGAS